MVKEIFPDVFKLRIPLPGSPLKHLNSYLIHAEGRCLLIDAGMDHAESLDELCRQLGEIGVRPHDLAEILFTHFHIDHVGLVSRLKRVSKARIMLHAREADLSRLISLRFGALWSDMESFYKVNGVPNEVALQMLRASPGFQSPAIYEELSKPSISLRGGEELSIGEYHFQVVWTPGHSPGHVCLYEPRMRFLIAGDHLLPTITPHVTQQGEEDQPLADYLDSLGKVEKLDVEAVLPAHEEAFTNHRERIQQIKEHHRRRANEILNEIQVQGLTAYQIASRIHWDVDYPSWEMFPAFQKYLAVGETLAHLKLLEKQNLAEKVWRAQLILYHAK